MNYEPAVKSLLLFVACVSFNYGFTPPNPPTPKGASFVYRGQHFETMVLIWTSPFFLNTFCPHPSTDLDRLQSISIAFFIGASGMILGGLLRVWCYITLGPLFTYLVTVVPGHKLITSGPYAYVRHPGYTGVFLMLVSTAFTHLATPGSYVMECGIMKSTVWKWVIRYWLVVSAFSLISLRRRGKVEDELMKKIFGDEWVTYSKAVPYSFIPYIL
ncbi:hypothetical protein GALMADRAFT_80333 [Galerina marginata CBS 339.88]|uniref:Protein-S-isoprenylcysteine O-methyltransferase n=1 Tax=Galerina marginata (strain CBS 339.88) TaxID=685588 RepID=A0A067SJI7_GALM3|nr:hypothetical protein GALMADRAFT_80333 [Galerina marginata CBS 339.88]